VGVDVDDLMSTEVRDFVRAPQDLRVHVRLP
jgi:hypothetical protein